MDCIARNGWRYDKIGQKQRWKCTKCDKRFTEDNGFWKMKNTPETITEAIDLYETGHFTVYLRNLANTHYLQDFYWAGLI